MRQPRLKTDGCGLLGAIGVAAWRTRIFGWVLGFMVLVQCAQCLPTPPTGTIDCETWDPLEAQLIPVHLLQSRDEVKDNSTTPNGGPVSPINTNTPTASHGPFSDPVNVVFAAIGIVAGVIIIGIAMFKIYVKYGGPGAGEPMWPPLDAPHDEIVQLVELIRVGMIDTHDAPPYVMNWLLNGPNAPWPPVGGIESLNRRRRRRRRGTRTEATNPMVEMFPRRAGRVGRRRQRRNSMDIAPLPPYVRDAEMDMNHYPPLPEDFPPLPPEFSPEGGDGQGAYVTDDLPIPRVAVLAQDSLESVMVDYDITQIDLHRMDSANSADSDETIVVTVLSPPPRIVDSRGRLGSI